jgi:TfoX/Sxy family transcriptional regulator of competence genes
MKMAYDEGLAVRISEILADQPDVTEKKMFGGLVFMVNDHMCVGIVNDMLMVRVGPDNYENALKMDHCREMDFTGRAMKGMVYISSEGIAEDDDLEYWLNLSVGFVKSLPPKNK